MILSSFLSALTHRIKAPTQERGFEYLMCPFTNFRDQMPTGILHVEVIVGAFVPF